MNTPISNNADCGVRGMIRFLQAENFRPSEIHRRLVAVYGEHVMNAASVQKWCTMFTNGRTDVHDAERSGRPSVFTDALKQKVNRIIRENRHVTISEVYEQCPEVPRTVVYEIVTEHLQYYKICACWVPRMLTDAHRAARMGAALMFLERYKRDGNAFLDQIVTGDETWISHNTPTRKRRSMEWHHAQSPKRPRKFKQTASARKLMASVFWDHQGILLVDFMPCNTTINADAYCATLRHLCQAIQNRRRGKLSRGIVLIDDNARPHIARQTQTLLHDAFHWDTFDHPP